MMTSLEAHEKNIEKKESALTDSRERFESIKSELEAMELELQTAATNKKKNGSKSHPLEAVLTEASNNVTRLKAILENNASSAKDEATELSTLSKSKKELQAALDVTTRQLEKLTKKFEDARLTYEDKARKLKSKEDLLQTLSTGMSATKGCENGYHDQLLSVKNDIAAEETTIRQSDLKRKMLEKESRAKEKEASAARLKNAALEKERDMKLAELNVAKEQLAALPPVADIEALEQNVTRKKRHVSTLKQAVEEHENNLMSILFSYTDPVPNFDRSKVKGTVAELIELPEEMLSRSTALEICAGSRLFNVVVESEVVATMLLKKGQLRKRVTMIPLNKISSQKVDKARTSTALSLRPGKVDLALDVIKYDREYSPAMQYVFGPTLICADADTAKSVTFHNNVRLRSVTLDGDVYDPSGSLSGGSRASSASILEKTQGLKKARKELEAAMTDLHAAELALATSQTALATRDALTKRAELLQYELDMKVQQLESNSNGQIIGAVERMKQEIIELGEIAATSTKRLEMAQGRLAEIERDISELSTHRESKLKQLQDEVKLLRREVGDASPRFKELQREFEMAKGEKGKANIRLRFSTSPPPSPLFFPRGPLPVLDILTAAELDLSNVDTAIAELTETMRTSQTDMDVVENELRAAEANAKKVAGQLAVELTDRAEADAAMQQLEAGCRERRAALSDLELAQRKAAADLDRLRTDRARWVARLRELDAGADGPWIAGQKQAPQEWGIPNWRARVLYVPQRPPTMPGTPRDFLATLGSFAAQRAWAQDVALGNP
ncbi:Structural maintenance of chromosomes protein 2, partial [Cladochytrium tenue]